ncbi:hypothetical protein OKW21_006652 [Catalinimonas alkaloidigena]|uniref:hypothetical protein n=1 Tax=Catalinimonas alkaloidigena TaxID=1075417 RepID=UPI002405FAE1|nr:hypothetical protein [Catalinimonas alkaloidigena]MDF9801343.1 hypothetical protein [Catalinimonas alkaloidigena]
MKNPYHILPLVGLALLTATTAGWLRLGLYFPISVNAGEHGAMMVGSFLGTLISLERAVVIKKYWAYLTPLLSGISTFFFLTHLSLVAYVLLAAASLGYAVMLYYLYQRHEERHMLLMIAGAVCWLIGNLLLVKSQLYPLAVSWWIGFLLLTITGERLDLGRFLPDSKLKSSSFLLAIAIFLLGLVFPFHGAGRMIFGSGLILMGVWLYRYDIARISIRKEGLTQFVAASLLCGYFWLLMCGALCLLSDFYYDAVLHSFFIGFVFSMIFAHGPIILPGVLKLSAKPYHPILYLWLFGLQLSLALRIIGSIGGIYELHQWSGLSNGLLIFAYLFSIGTIAARQNLKNRAASQHPEKILS